MLTCLAFGLGTFGLPSQAWATCGDYLIASDGPMGGHGLPQAALHPHHPSRGAPFTPGTPVRHPCRSPECSSHDGSAVPAPSPAPESRNSLVAALAAGEAPATSRGSAALATNDVLNLPLFAFRLLRPPR